MELALREAQVALEQDEVPVGAIITCENKIIAKAHNQTEQLMDCTAHAEMIALSSAFNLFGSKYLPDATLYVSLEPCCMCAGALFWSQIKRVVIAAKDPTRGFSKFKPNMLHPKTEVSFGLCQSQSEYLLQTFFDKIRSK